jgi:hypothetical protein
MDLVVAPRLECFIFRTAIGFNVLRDSNALNIAKSVNESGTVYRPKWKWMLLLSRKWKLTEKSIATQTQDDAIFSNLAVKTKVGTIVIANDFMSGYIRKLHDKNIIITNNFLQMSP